MLYDGSRSRATSGCAPRKPVPMSRRLTPAQWSKMPRGAQVAKGSRAAGGRLSRPLQRPLREAEPDGCKRNRTSEHETQSKTHQPFAKRPSDLAERRVPKVRVRIVRMERVGDVERIDP